jgi:hypothetical protein
MSAAAPATAEQEREDQIGLVDELDLDELAERPDHGDAGGGNGHDRQPPARPRHTGYGRRRPPRWQLIVVWAIAMVLCFLAGFLITEGAHAVSERLIARAEGH